MRGSGRGDVTSLDPPLIKDILQLVGEEVYVLEVW